MILQCLSMRALSQARLLRLKLRWLSRHSSRDLPLFLAWYLLARGMQQSRPRQVRSPTFSARVRACLTRGTLLRRELTLIISLRLFLKASQFFWTNSLSLVMLSKLNSQFSLCLKNSSLTDSSRVFSLVFSSRIFWISLSLEQYLWIFHLSQALSLSVEWWKQWAATMSPLQYSHMPSRSIASSSLYLSPVNTASFTALLYSTAARSSSNHSQHNRPMSRQVRVARLSRPSRREQYSMSRWMRERMERLCWLCLQRQSSQQRLKKSLDSSPSHCFSDSYRSSPSQSSTTQVLISSAILTSSATSRLHSLSARVEKQTMRSSIRTYSLKHLRFSLLYMKESIVKNSMQDLLGLSSCLRVLQGFRLKPLVEPLRLPSTLRLLLWVTLILPRVRGRMEILLGLRWVRPSSLWLMFSWLWLSEASPDWKALLMESMILTCEVFSDRMGRCGMFQQTEVMVQGVESQVQMCLAFIITIQTLFSYFGRLQRRNNKNRVSLDLHRPLLAPTLLLQSPLVPPHLVGLQGVDVVDNPLLPLSPDLVEFVKEQLQLALADLSVAEFNEVAAVVVGLLWHPQEGFGDEGFVAGAEMKVGLVSWSIQFGLHRLVDVGQEADAVVIQGKLCEFIVFIGGFKQLKQPSGVMPVIFVFHLAIVKVEVLAVEGRQLIGQCSLSIPQVFDSLLL